jgi:hypothetical protein
VLAIPLHHDAMGKAYALILGLLLGLHGLDRQVWGVLPTGLTVVDLVILFGAGAVGVILAFLRDAGGPLETAGSRIV